MPSEPNPQQVAAHSVLNGRTDLRANDGESKKKNPLLDQKRGFEFGVYCSSGSECGGCVSRGLLNTLAAESLLLYRQLQKCPVCSLRGARAPF